MLTRTSVLLAVVLGTGVWTGRAAGETWDHLHLTVSDTAGAAKWYAKHFGGKVTKSGRVDAVLFGSNLMKFRRGGAEVSGSRGSSVDHIAFSVKDVDAKAAALREDGVTVARPKRRIPGVIFATDPWGTRIELLKDEDLLGFHHVHLKSRKPRGTVDWYVKVFGGKPAKFKKASGMTVIRYGDMYLFVQSAIQALAPTNGRSVDHLGWRFKDFDATVKRLKGLGVKFLMEPTKSGDHMIAFIEGPDGVKIEVVESTSEPTKSALQIDPEGWIDIMPRADLEGWSRVPVPPTGKLGRAQWHVDTDRKVLICDGDGGHDMLLLKKVLDDAIFHFEFCYTKIEGRTGYNSGAYVRNSSDGAIWHQAQFGDAGGGFLFGVTPTAEGKTKFFRLKKEVKDGRVKPAGEWNTMEVTARGSTLALWVNGAVTCEFNNCGKSKGHVGLEGEGYRVEFRNLKVKRLPVVSKNSTGP